jgi:RHH-type transcriptional regulator, rel operon repressor / antitoxin RelB
MSSISIRLNDELAARLEKLSKRTGRTKSFYIVKAIEGHLQDLEDIYVAEQRLIEVRAGRSRTYTLDEVERELGVAD